MVWRPSRVGVVFGAAVVFAVSCATQKVELPEFTGPSVVTSVPAGSAIVLYTPPPTSAATPSPNPSPGSTPSPAPSPDPQPTPRPGGSCALPPGTGDGEHCDRTNPTFLDQVDATITRLVETEPSLFDLHDSKCSNCYRVVDTERFVAGVVAGMIARGLCANYDGEELAVKNTNDFNDQYDILTADLYLRRGDGSYRATCWPAVF